MAARAKIAYEIIGAEGEVLFRSTNRAEAIWELRRTVANHPEDVPVLSFATVIPNGKNFRLLDLVAGAAIYELLENE